MFIRVAFSLFSCVYLSLSLYLVEIFGCFSCRKPTTDARIPFGQADRKRQADMKKAQLAKEALLEEGEYEAAVRYQPRL